MPLYTFTQNFLHVLVQIANKMGLQKKMLNLLVPLLEKMVAGASIKWMVPLFLQLSSHARTLSVSTILTATGM
jgi:hypothetical protein